MNHQGVIIKILYIAKGFNEKDSTILLENLTLSLDRTRRVRCVFTFLPSSYLGLKSTTSTCFDIIFIEHDIPIIHSNIFVNVLRRHGAVVPVIDVINSQNVINENDSPRLFFDYIIYPYTKNDLNKMICKVLDYLKFPNRNDLVDTFNAIETINNGNFSSSNDQTTTAVTFNDLIPIISIPKSDISSRAVNNFIDTPSHLDTPSNIQSVSSTITDHLNGDSTLVSPKNKVVDENKVNSSEVLILSSTSCDSLLTINRKRKLSNFNDIFSISINENDKIIDNNGNVSGDTTVYDLFKSYLYTDNDLKNFDFIDE